MKNKFRLVFVCVLCMYSIFVYSALNCVPGYSGVSGSGSIAISSYNIFYDTSGIRRIRVYAPYSGSFTNYDDAQRMASYKVIVMNTLYVTSSPTLAAANCDTQTPTTVPFIGIGHATLNYSGGPMPLSASIEGWRSTTSYIQLFYTTGSGVAY